MLSNVSRIHTIKFRRMAVTGIMAWGFFLMIFACVNIFIVAVTNNNTTISFSEASEKLGHDQWLFLLSPYISCSVLLVIGIILFVFIRLDVNKRQSLISLNVVAWYVGAISLFTYSSINPIYLIGFQWNVFEYILRLAPLSVVFYILYNITKILNIELNKAFDAEYKYTVDYRRNYLNKHHKELLKNEDKFYDDFRKNTSKWRMRLIRHYVDYELPQETLVKYYREPILLFKLAQLHYCKDSNLDNKDISEEHSERIMEIPSTFDFYRIEQDIQMYYFNPNALKEYLYILSTRFVGQDHQDQLQKLVTLYGIDTGLTIEQQNRIEHKMKWRQREAEELWKEAEERWVSISEERRLKGDDYIDRIRATLHRKRDSEERNHLLDEVEKMRDNYDKRKSIVYNDESLAIIERKEQLRILQRAYIAQLDEFERAM